MVGVRLTVRMEIALKIPKIISKSAPLNMNMMTIFLRQGILAFQIIYVDVSQLLERLEVEYSQEGELT